MSDLALRSQHLASQSCSCGAELRRLRDRVEELEDLIGLGADVVRPIGMSATEWRLASLLLRRPTATREFLHRAMYGARPEVDQPTSNIIDQTACRLNRRFRTGGHKIQVRSQYGGVYYFTAEDKRRLRELVDVAGRG